MPNLERRRGLPYAEQLAGPDAGKPSFGTSFTNSFKTAGTNHHNVSPWFIVSSADKSAVFFYMLLNRLSSAVPDQPAF